MWRVIRTFIICGLLLVLTLSLMPGSWASDCVKLHKGFIPPDIKIDFRAYERHEHYPARIEATYKGYWIGYVNYERYGDWMYIEMVQVKDDFQKMGVHSLLLRRLLEHHDPVNHIELRFGGVNRQEYVKGIASGLMYGDFNIIPNEFLKYILPRLDLVPDDVLVKAVDYTPTGKVLEREGFKVVSTNVHAYPLEIPQHMIIDIKFRRER